MSTVRVGLAFHETLPLSLPSVAAILRLSCETEGKIDASTIRAKTSLGPNYIKAMPRYARACGLMEMGSYKLTPLGQLVSQKDPHMMDSATLWLMHYHISAPQGPGPEFWSHLVTEYLQFEVDVGAESVSFEIAQFLQKRPGELVLQGRTIRSTTTIFVGTYTKQDGLGRLGLLQKVAGRNGGVWVAESQSPPLGVVAYTLADYWSVHHGEKMTISLSDLSRDGGFGRLMWMDPRRLNEALDGLKSQGVLDIYRVAPPYQVARCWSDKEELQARLYD